MLGPLPPLLVVGGHPLRAWYVVGEAAFNLINPREDVARAIESGAGLLGYLMGLTVVTLESRFSKFNAPSEIA